MRASIPTRRSRPRRGTVLPALSLLLLPFLQGPAPPGATGAGGAEEAPPVQPWSGPIAEGLASLIESVESREGETALRTAEALAGRVQLELGQGGERVDESLLAEVHFALGVARDGLGASGPALGSYESALALAGPGELRRAAAYNAALVHLDRGERWRERMIAASAQQPGAAAPAAPGAATQEQEQPDPAEMARRSYERARDAFVLRLRFGAAGEGDRDARANLELAVRRLRELEQQEQEQEEQQPPQDDSQQQQQQEGEQQEGEQQEGEQQEGEQQEGEQQEGEQQEGEQQEGEQQEGEQQQGEQQQGEQQEGEGQEGEGQGEEESPGAGEEPDAGEEQQAPQAEGAGEELELQLTKEEVQRLLDRLEQLDRQAEELEAALRRIRRVPVEKDW